MSAYDEADSERKRQVDDLIRDTNANGGMAPLDVEQFWRDQEKAAANPFGADIPQCMFGAILTGECVFDELGEMPDWRRFMYEDEPWALELSKRYNDLAEKIVGRRLLNELPRDSQREWPKIKELHDIFEAENAWEGGANGSWWLKQSVYDQQTLTTLLDRVEKRLDNLKDFLFPENWSREKQRLLNLGCEVPLYRYQRGPCTFATSIFGAENLLLLYYDNPALMQRFSELICRAIMERARLIDAEAGPACINAKTRGWWWADDNCCLFTPEMYEFFAMPIHRKVFAAYAAHPGAERHQHSDSAMSHLLPLLQELDLTGTNFGPTVTVSEIRKYCPHARIDGQMAPFTYSRNEERNMVAEFLRDFDQAKEKRGLNFATAGSINNGSRLSGMRLLMAAVQRYGRY